jgi:DNA polymerase/3'-5' exonuclease PolX
MSAGVDIPLEDARAAAEDLRALLAPACDRIEIAGSVRRRRPVVHDIELVAIPRVIDRAVEGLLFTRLHPVDMLKERVDDLLSSDLAPLAARKVENHRRDGSLDVQEKLGSAFKALTWHDIPVDLFITDAERWGCIFALRTGPGDWNARLVTDCRKVNRSVAGGRVLHLGKPVPTPEEADFFRELGQPWIDPWERRVERVAIGWPVPA